MAEEDRNYEQEASGQGWKPESEWNNPDKQWIDAQTFVERGEKILPIVQSQRDRAQEKNVQFESRIARLEAANKEFGEYKDSQLARSEARNKDLLSELSLRRSQAVTDNDGEAFYKADKEFQDVKDSMSFSPPPASNGGEQPNNPLFDAWVINNDWYSTDPALRAIADGVEGQIASEGYSGPAYYSEVTRRVKELSPDSFGNKKRSGSTSVEQGGELETKPDSTAHVYENLPSDAKAACDRFVAGGTTTKESYCETYEWD